MKQLTIDEMLEAAEESGMPLSENYVGLVEALATQLGEALALHLKVRVLNAASFEPGFGGTCVNFGPDPNGVMACPEVLSHHDPGDWESEHGIQTKANV
jgi:hypothetical protein